jgi:cyclic pyranopterin phosphate synthase
MPEKGKGKRKLTHIDKEGAARMVDVSCKGITAREAVASSFVEMKPATVKVLKEGAVEKGDVLAAALLAGIMAAKRTHELIPLCHPLPIEKAEIELAIEDRGVSIRAIVKTSARTGVEMEALTAASVAALTIYDMCKALERGMTIGPIRLESKTGGARGNYRRGKK